MKSEKAQNVVNDIESNINIVAEKTETKDMIAPVKGIQAKGIARKKGKHGDGFKFIGFKACRDAGFKASDIAPVSALFKALESAQEVVTQLDKTATK
tara:strand:- start:272 stop:562 length:291 start_codon:yes stop_codon:yes gene_type:complete